MGGRTGCRHQQKRPPNKEGVSPIWGEVLLQGPSQREHDATRVVGGAGRWDGLASPIGLVASVRGPYPPVGPWRKCPPAAGRPPPLFCPGAYRRIQGSARGTQVDAGRLGGGRWAGRWPHALGGEIKEEGAAAGRRRRTVAGKGIGAQRPTRRWLCVESVMGRFCLPRVWAKSPKKTPRNAGRSSRRGTGAISPGSRARRCRCRPGADDRSSFPDRPAAPANAPPSRRYGPGRT